MQVTTLEICPGCMGGGYTLWGFSGYSVSEDGLSIIPDNKTIVCEECNGYGIRLNVIDVPDDIVIISQRITRKKC